MKKISIIRHGKSSWEMGANSKDFDRPLNPRGTKDVPLMATILKERHLIPDLIISSPAKRAFSTAILFATILEVKKPIQLEEDIYYKSVEEGVRILQNIDDSIDHVMYFGHQPTLAMLHTFLSGNQLMHLPTTGVSHLHLKIESWKGLAAQTTDNQFIIYPKMFK